MSVRAGSHCGCWPPTLEGLHDQSLRTPDGTRVDKPLRDGALLIDAAHGAVEEVDEPRGIREDGGGGRGPVEGRRRGSRQSSIDRRIESAVIHNTLQLLHRRYPPVAAPRETGGRVQRGKKRRKQAAIRLNKDAAPLVGVPNVMDTNHLVLLLPYQVGVVIRKRPVPVIRIGQRWAMIETKG